MWRQDQYIARPASTVYNIDIALLFQNNSSTERFWLNLSRAYGGPIRKAQQQLRASKQQAKLTSAPVTVETGSKRKAVLTDRPTGSPPQRNNGAACFALRKFFSRLLFLDSIALAFQTIDTIGVASLSTNPSTYPPCQETPVQKP